MSETSVFKYRVVVEEMGGGGYSAYSPDVPGCITTAETASEILKEMHEALSLHLEGLQKDGDPIPKAKAAGPNDKVVEVRLPVYVTA